MTGTKFAGGSSWSSAYIYTTALGKQLFVKTALGRDPAAMFRGEAEGLRAMHATRTVRIPEVLHYGPLPSAPGGGALRGDGRCGLLPGSGLAPRWCRLCNAGRCCSVLLEAHKAAVDIS